MSIWLSIGVFCASLALSASASVVLARNLDKVGNRLDASAGLLGIITALGADAPEISSAVAALLGGHRDLGVGVVLGSNIFNLAALLGLSAVVAGRISIGWQGLAFNGGVAALVMALGGTLVLGWLSAAWVTTIVTVTLLAYVALSALHARQAAHIPLPGAARRFLCAAVEQGNEGARKDEAAPQATWNDALALIPALVSIVLASVWMVRSAVDLAGRWGLPHTVVGPLILATLTGLPNVVAALRLARHGRGTAVVSEALNSNSLNILAGICLPALILGLGGATGQTRFEVWWLLGLTIAAVVLTCARGALRSKDGWAIIALYVVFAGVLVTWVA